MGMTPSTLLYSTSGDAGWGFPLGQASNWGRLVHRRHHHAHRSREIVQHHRGAPAHGRRGPQRRLQLPHQPGREPEHINKTGAGLAWAPRACRWRWRAVSPRSPTRAKYIEPVSFERCWTPTAGEVLDATKRRPRAGLQAFHVPGAGRYTDHDMLAQGPGRTSAARTWEVEPAPTNPSAASFLGHHQLLRPQSIGPTASPSPATGPHWESGYAAADLEDFMSKILKETLQRSSAVLRKNTRSCQMHRPRTATFRQQGHTAAPTRPMNTAEEACPTGPAQPTKARSSAKR